MFLMIYVPEKLFLMKNTLNLTGYACQTKANESSSCVSFAKCILHRSLSLLHPQARTRTRTLFILAEVLYSGPPANLDPAAPLPVPA